MTPTRAHYSGFLILATIFPYAVQAQSTSVSEVAGLFNIMVGLMFVAGTVTFFGGVISYFVDFGNQDRLKGITLMEWGVAILFVLAVLLGAVQFFESHEAATNVLVAVVVIIAAIWSVLSELTAAQKPAKKEESKPS